MEKSFIAVILRTLWKLEGAQGDLPKFGSVGDLCAGVLNLVGLGCGDVCAALGGCCLGWLCTGYTLQGMSHHV